MARYFGKIGFATPTKKAGGVWEDKITERQLTGDVTRNSRRLEAGEKVNSDISVGNTISVVADEFANQHFHAIRYAEYAGALWVVEDVTVERPRLILRLGGVYNGPKA